MGLSLETWRRTFGLDAQHFWQLEGPKAPVTAECSALTYEYAWQAADAVGRHDIRLAIAEAERKLALALGYRLAPEYIEVELPWAGSLALPEGHILAGGTEALTSLGTASVTYADLDSDDVPDRATATFTLAQALPAGAEVAVYHSAANRYDGTGIGPRWLIEPVQVQVSGLTLTISCPAWVLVRPVLYQGRKVRLADIDAADTANYAATVEIVQRATDTTQAGYVRWEQAPWPGWLDCCAGTGTQSLAGLELRDARLGIVAPTFADSCAWPWAGRCREPDRIVVRYRAGLPLVDGDLDPRWQLTVARLAAAELAAPICGCAESNRSIAEWQFDLSRAAGKMDEQFQLSGRHLDCPWGTRRGHVYAWEQAADQYQARGIAL